MDIIIWLIGSFVAMCVAFSSAQRAPNWALVRRESYYLDVASSALLGLVGSYFGVVIVLISNYIWSHKTGFLIPLSKKSKIEAGL
jgi:hypothetical protein